jgi:2-keto-3-deoxy-L-arabinonate dehydratase
VSLLPRGLHPIIYALFDAKGDLDRQAMRRQIEVCIAQGAVGIATLGLATEVRHLSTEQQRQIVEWNVEDIAGRVPLGVTIFAQPLRAPTGWYCSLPRARRTRRG